MKCVGTIVCPDALRDSRLAGFWIAGAAFAAEACTVVRTHFAIFQPACACAITCAHAVANGCGVGHAEGNVRANAFVRVDVARLARPRAGAVAANAIGTERTLAIPAHRARVAVALFAVRPAAIHACFIAILHAVGARDALLVEAGIGRVWTIIVRDALDTHRHVVADAAVAVRPRLSVGRHRHAVVAALDRAHVAVEGRRIVVVVHDDEVAVAVT